MDAEQSDVPRVSKSPGYSIYRARRAADMYTIYERSASVDAAADKPDADTCLIIGYIVSALRALLLRRVAQSWRSGHAYNTQIHLSHWNAVIEFSFMVLMFIGCGRKFVYKWSRGIKIYGRRELREAKCKSSRVHYYLGRTPH
jgi:hypothetical protein